MNEVIVMPDAEAVVITCIKDAIDNLPVSTIVPNPRPNRLVRVSRIGGTQIRLNADSAIVVIECWDTDTVQASDLCALVRAHIHAMEGETVNGVWVYRVIEVGGPSYFPDPNTTLPRYQFTVAIDLRGQAI